MNERINLPPLMKNAAARQPGRDVPGGAARAQCLSKAAKWLKRASEQEYAQAQFMLGNMHMHGSGPVAQSYVAAAELYGKAAAQGNEVASYNLGSCTATLGRGPERHSGGAPLPGSRGAGLRQGPVRPRGPLPRRQRRRGPRTFGAAVGWLTRAAEEGHLQAQNTLGGLYHGGTLQGSSHGSSGGGGGDRSSTRTQQSFDGSGERRRKRQEALGGGRGDSGGRLRRGAAVVQGGGGPGHADSQNSLGRMHFVGGARGARRPQGLRVVREGRDQGHDGAQFNLGLMHEKGWGIGGGPNYDKAVVWYEKAAAQHHEKAKFNLKYIYDVS